MSVVGGDAELGEDMARTYTTAPVYNHGPGGLAAFLRGLDIDRARHHRGPAMARPRLRPRAGRRGQAWAAVGYKTPVIGEEEL